jgi:amino acid transporter
MNDYKNRSLSLTGAVSLGTGIMIGAGIFELLGQVAEQASMMILIFVGEKWFLTRNN